MVIIAGASDTAATHIMLMHLVILLITSISATNGISPISACILDSFDRGIVIEQIYTQIPW